MVTKDTTRQSTAPGDAFLAPVSFRDIGGAIAAGVKDFAAAPVVSICIALIYTLGGWLLAALLWQFNMPFLVYPVAMGFALVAPFVAVAFYEVSRSLATNVTPTVYKAWCAVCDAKNRDIRWMALITSFAFFLWMDMAAMITLSFFGAAALDLGELLTQIRTTTHGWIFLVVGHVVGAAIALLVFSISVISIPMLFDRREVGIAIDEQGSEWLGHGGNGCTGAVGGSIRNCSCELFLPGGGAESCACVVFRK